MEKIVDYQIVSSWNQFTDSDVGRTPLELRVRELIAQGWRPTGGVTETDGGTYLQAMVKVVES